MLDYINNLEYVVEEAAEDIELAADEVIFSDGNEIDDITNISDEELADMLDLYDAEEDEVDDLSVLL